MPILLDYIKHKIKRGYSPIILFVGKQRVGKTSLALRIAYEINKDFSVQTDMFFDIRKFAKAIHEGKNKVFILDEAGVTLDPYEHMSISQRVYNHIIQTQAYKNNAIFLVLPFASEIGKQHRKHVNAIVEVYSRGCYKLYATHSWYSDLSMKPPRLRHIETVQGVPLPPEHIWKPYLEFGQKQYKEDIMQIQMEMLDKKFTPQQKFQAVKI